jgi:class 3 adenylate cyclase/tetratricopeptide (TPR) repeat protein
MATRRSAGTAHNAYASVLAREVASSDASSTGPVQRVAATLLFADVSGYTALTERLATLGRAGAEIVTDTINACFTKLITAAASFGGDVLRFGGDALFIAFTGDDRVARGVSAAQAMQRAIATLPAIAVPGGKVRLRQSIGLHDGELILVRWDGSWTEVMPVGPAVSAVLACESAANAGQIALSKQLARRLPLGAVRRRADGVPLLNRNYRSGAVAPMLGSPKGAADGRGLLPVALREALDGRVGSEHRPACIGFVAISGLDALAKDPKLLARRLHAIMDAADAAATELGVTPMATDVSPDGLKLIVAAGVPTATEDDAARIIEATRRICKAAPKHASAGIHLGVVFSGDVGHPKRRSYTVMGDAVNLAARLAYRAPTGSVLASQQLLTSSGAPYAVTWLEPFKVKGKQAAQVAGIVGRPRRARPSQSTHGLLRGRSSEVRQVRASLAAARCVEIVGPSGAGASHLVHHVLSADHRTTVSHTATVESATRPLEIVRRLVEALSGATAWADLSKDVFGRKSISGAPVDAVWVTARLVDRVLAIWPTDTDIVIDRSQHVDEASLRVARGLASALLERPDISRRLIVVGRAARLSGSANVVHLGELSDRDIRGVVTDAIHVPLSDADVDRIVRSAAGSPGLAKALASLGGVAELPPTFEALIGARLDRLPLGARRLIRELAVTGGSLSIEQASRVLAVPERDLADAVRLATDLVSVRGQSFVFVDDTARSVAALGLPVARLRTLHARLLQLGTATKSMSASEMANHAIEAGNHRQAARWSIAAAERAIGAGASDEATTHLANAVAAARTAGWSDARVAALANQWALMAERSARASDLDRALVIALRHERRPAERSALLIRQARAARVNNRLARARRLLDQAHSEAPSSAGAMHHLIDIELGWVMVSDGKLADALDISEQVLNSAGAVHDARVEFEAASLARFVRSATGLPGAMKLGRRAVRAARRTGDQRSIGIAVGNVALMADNNGRWQSAQVGYRRAEAAFSRAGDVLNMVGARMNRASILVEVGAVEGIADGLSDAIRCFAAGGDTLGAAMASALWSRATARVGGAAQDVDLCVRISSAVQQVVESQEHEIAGAFHKAGEIEVLLLLCRSTEASTKANMLIQSIEASGGDSLLAALACRLAAIAYWQLGRTKSADRRFLDALEFADQSGVIPIRAAVRSAMRARSRTEATAADVAFDRLGGVVSSPWFRAPTLR